MRPRTLSGTCLATCLAASLAVACPAQEGRTLWRAPGKGDLQLELVRAAARPAPFVLVAGTGAGTGALARDLCARGITTAILGEPRRETLPAAHGLLGAHAGELGLDPRRSALVAAGDGAEAALHFAVEQRAAVQGLVLLGTFAPVIESLRADLPLCVVAEPGDDAATAAGQRELAHQAALAGAPVQFAAGADPVATAVRFLAARLLPPPADGPAADRAAAVGAELLERARAAADRGDLDAALRQLDRALAAAPELAPALAADHAFARIRQHDRFRAALRARAPAGRLRLAPGCEAGRPIEVRCRFTGPDGAPLADALVEVWQTDALGIYDHSHPGEDRARLWGAVRTDREGVFVLHSVRPGGYPGTMIPAHVHLRVQHGGRSRGVELWFADDPRLPQAFAERAALRGWAVADLDAEGRGGASFGLPAR